MTIAPIIAYASARIARLASEPTCVAQQAAIIELEAILVLCKGLLVEEEMLVLRMMTPVKTLPIQP